MPPDRLTLGFDTSAAHCAAALLCGDEVLAVRAEAMDRGQAERLVPMLEEVLAEAGAGWRELHRIGCGVGPGNFTGVRIAVAAARALTLASGVKAVGVSRFEALALGQPRPCLVALDARGGQSYVQAFGVAGPGAPLLVPAGEAVPIAGYAAVIGDAPWLEAATMPGPAALVEAIARIAAGAEAPAVPAPLYLRPADAAPPRDPPPVILP